MNDLDLLDVAIGRRSRKTARPSLIIVDTHIGWGAPNRQDTKEAHGEALGVEEVRLTKEAYGWPPDAQFLVPDEVRAYMGKAVERGAQWESEWNDKLQSVVEGQCRPGEDVAADGRSRAAGGMGQGHSDVPRRREGAGDARVEFQGGERGGEERAVAAGRGG